MIHANIIRLTLVAATVLVGLGSFGAVARGQLASPAAGTPVSGGRQTEFNVAERAYLDEMNPIVTAVHDSLGRYAELSKDPQILGLDWLAKAAFEFMFWRSAYKDALAIEPPPAFAESHGLHLEALGLLAETYDDVSAAMNEGDIVGLMSIGTKITRATSLFDQATALMDNVTARGGVGPVASPAAATPVSAREADAATLRDAAGAAGYPTPTPAGEVSGQVNVMVEVNTYLGLGSLSTGRHVIHSSETAACTPANDEP